MSAPSRISTDDHDHDPSVTREELLALTLSTLQARLAANDHALHEALIARFQTGETGLFDVFLHAHNGLLAHLVKRAVAVYPNNRDDLWQQARIGLWHAYQRYDPDRLQHAQPITVLFIHVRAEVYRWHIDCGSTVRFPNYLTGRIGVRGGQGLLWKRSVVPFSDLYETGESIVDYDELIARLHEGLQQPPPQDELDDKEIALVQRLTPMERDILAARFQDEPLHLEEIATRYGKTRERIRQLQEQALMVLRVEVLRWLAASPATWQDKPRTYHAWVSRLIYAYHHRAAKTDDHHPSPTSFRRRGALNPEDPHLTNAKRRLQATREAWESQA